MGESRARRAAVTCIVSLLMIIGFTVAPAAAVVDDGLSLTDNDSISIDLDDDSPVSVDVEDDVTVGVGDEDVSVGDNDITDSDGTLPSGDDLPSTDGTDEDAVSVGDNLDEVGNGDDLPVSEDDISLPDAGGSDDVTAIGDDLGDLGLVSGDDLPVSEDDVGLSDDSLGENDALSGVDDAVPDAGTGDALGDTESPIDNDQVPDEACTDVGDPVQEEVPFEQVPWIDELPSEAQPEGVPWDVVTPGAAASIAFSMAPTQCQVFDPRDPSYDPLRDGIAPDTDGEVVKLGQDRGGASSWVTYYATLDETGDGPGASIDGGPLVTQEFGDAEWFISVNDGEKEYGLEPRVRYWDDGTAFAKQDVVLYGKRLGVNMDCDGEECQPGTEGLPELQEYPPIPVATSQDGGSDDQMFPEEMCTDVGDPVQEEVPFEQVPWIDELPSEAQPEGVPWDVVTPGAAASIAFSMAPTQCQVFDPRDPSYDPLRDGIAPDTDGEVVKLGQDRGGASSWVTYYATLDETGDGPGASIDGGPLVTQEFGDAEWFISVNDGEKEYGLEPRVRYWDDGTAFAKQDVVLYGTRLGVNMDCDGEECQPGTAGLPQLQEYPPIPAPSAQE